MVLDIEKSKCWSFQNIEPCMDMISEQNCPDEIVQNITNKLKIIQMIFENSLKSLVCFWVADW